MNGPLGRGLTSLKDCFFMEKNRNTVEDKALYYGLQALLETRHSS